MGRQQVVITECKRPATTAAATFYPQLFDGFLKSSYRKWKTSSMPWQLRVVGGPGSGKTSLAALVVQDLGKSFKTNPCRVVLSAFLSTATNGDNLTCQETKALSVADLSTQFLSQIETQLDRHLAGTTTVQAVEGRRRKHVGNAKISKQASIQVLRIGDEDGHSPSQHERIRSKVSGLTHVYLVIDDLDLAWLHPREYFPLEETLAWLEGLGIRILATSRTYYRKNTPWPSCDVVLPKEGSDEDRVSDDSDEPERFDPRHKDHCFDNPEKLVAWWWCDMCMEDVEIDPDDITVVCEACRREGYGCTRPEHSSSSLTYKRRIMHIDMGNVLDQGLRGLIEHLLQAEHGQFILGPPIVDSSLNKNMSTQYPPLTNLGRQLLPQMPVSSPVNDPNSLQPSLHGLVLSPSSNDSARSDNEETRTNGSNDQDNTALKIRSRRALRLVNILYGQSHHNVANILCRLETIHEIDSELEDPAAREKNPDGTTINSDTNLEAIFELENADRLPRPVIAMFDAIVDRHVHEPLRNHTSSKNGEQQEELTRAAIALHAIRYLARRYNDDKVQWVEFWELKETLLEEDSVCGHGFRELFVRVRQLQGQDDSEEDAEYNLLDYVVSTAAGLLIMARGTIPEYTDVGFFDADFRLYASEDYNSFLASGKCF